MDNDYPVTRRHRESNQGRSGDKQGFYPCTIQAHDGSLFWYDWNAVEKYIKPPNHSSKSENLLKKLCE